MNKSAGFWIRFFSRMLDSIFVFSIVISFAYVMLEKQNGVWAFKQDHFFYIWILFFSLLLFIWFILIPLFWRGQTPFMRLCKIQIKFNSKMRFISLLKRELFFSLSWIFMALIVMMIINHTLIIKFALTNRTGVNLSGWEQARITAISSVGSILMVIQFIFSISIIVKENKIAIHDQYSETNTIWINKFIEKIEIKIKKIKPVEISNNPVIWINKGANNE